MTAVSTAARYILHQFIFLHYLAVGTARPMSQIRHAVSAVVDS